jgi:hypothetical protein
MMVSPSMVTVLTLKMRKSGVPLAVLRSIVAPFPLMMRSTAPLPVVTTWESVWISTSIIDTGQNVETAWGQVDGIGFAIAVGRDDGVLQRGNVAIGDIENSRARGGKAIKQMPQPRRSWQAVRVFTGGFTLKVG